MELYLAMDVKRGRVVWGCGGNREKYESIEKHSFVSSPIPEKVLEEIKPKRIYVADLDAIEKIGKNDLKFLKLVKKAIVDRGFTCREEVVEFQKEIKEIIEVNGIEAGIKTEINRKKVLPVLGSETYDLRGVLDGTFVSLDFKGKFLCDLELKEAIELLNTYELEGVIVLDMSSVGKERVNYELISYVLSSSSNPVYAAGGIRGMDDLEKLEEMGVKGAILATAVHKKRIPLKLIR